MQTRFTTQLNRTNIFMVHTAKKHNFTKSLLRNNFIFESIRDLLYSYVFIRLRIQSRTDNNIIKHNFD